jgi:signal peptidase I
MDISPNQPLTEKTEAEKVQRPSFWKGAWGEIIQTLIMAVILYFVIDAVFERVMVLNISMQPTLYQGDLILVNKLAYKLGKMNTGDVVIFHNPNLLEEDYIKRLIGKPGDVVKVEGGVVYVNGTALKEPYIAAPPEYADEWTVPANSVFVLGDNRNNSSDSHSWGFVPVSDIVGKALVVYWPLNAMKILSHPDYGFPLKTASP